MIKKKIQKKSKNKDNNYLIDNKYQTNRFINFARERKGEREIESTNKLMNYYAEPVIRLNQFKLIDGNYVMIAQMFYHA